MLWWKCTDEDLHYKFVEPVQRQFILISRSHRDESLTVWNPMSYIQIWRISRRLFFLARGLHNYYFRLGRRVPNWKSNNRFLTLECRSTREFSGQPMSGTGGKRPQDLEISLASQRLAIYKYACISVALGIRFIILQLILEIDPHNFLFSFYSWNADKETSLSTRWISNVCIHEALIWNLNERTLPDS